MEESVQDDATPSAAEPQPMVEAQPTAETGPTAEPEPTASSEVANQIETTMAESANGPLINEDVRRYPTFNINTLAYELPGMDAVEVVNVTYAFHGDRTLTMDAYYPPGTADGIQLPAVVFGIGYRMSREPLRNEHFYASWGRLVAAAGMVGIVYDTEQPDRDLEVLMAFIREQAAELRVDPAQIGLMSTSASVPTVMSYLMQEERSGIQFAVYYYGHSLTPDRKYAKGFGEICAQRGCLLNELADITYVDPNVPLFIVKAGQDFVADANEGWDHFVNTARAEGAEVTVIDYEGGVHGFDTQQKTEESAQILADTVAFMRANFGLEALGN